MFYIEWGINIFLAVVFSSSSSSFAHKSPRLETLFLVQVLVDEYKFSSKAKRTKGRSVCLHVKGKQYSGKEYLWNKSNQTVVH